MPIKPENKDRYPDDWDETRQRILERDGHKCKNCGAENYAEGWRDMTGQFWEIETLWKHMNAGNDDIQFPDDGADSKIRIVLTIAHLDHIIEHGEDKNLAALCQKCHLAHDRQDNIKKARETRRKKEGEAGQTFLFGTDNG